MASKWISKRQRVAIYNRDDFTCCYCGKHCTQGNSRDTGISISDLATLDHIVPQKELAACSTDDAHFGKLRRDPKNLVVVCMTCNASKKHLPLYVWCAQTRRDYAIILAEISIRINRTI
jgi:5-methylcytosine-specific restriction endonuclease McrA